MNTVVVVNNNQKVSWIEAHLLYLSQVFFIDICAYAVMSNHLHIVPHVDEKQAKNWSTHEVLKR
ncbi:hypothetical protein [Marinomonas sp. 2405UD68-3]|uniref:hypothetical protein n=1 Tax=Marinomonas sp. 2405UD68-3 TaxID=3391835 RepID=UPI0039C9EBF9